MELKVEIRVRPVTRYIVTRYYQEYNEDSERGGAGSSAVGEFDNETDANRVAEAVASCEPAGISVQCFPIVTDFASKHPHASDCAVHTGPVGPCDCGGENLTTAQRAARIQKPTDQELERLRTRAEELGLISDNPPRKTP
jgi:hypothetical protein